MNKRILVLISGTTLCVGLTAPPALAQENPRQGSGDPKVVIKDDMPNKQVVIKDDTTPKLKKGARVVSDATIATAVRTRLMKDKVARGTSIDVETKDGVVTIAGTVPTPEDKARIGRLVLRTSGVKKVENNLTVGK